MAMKTPRRLTNADIALAMELRTVGVQYKRIAIGLGVCAKTLRANLKYAEQNGYRKETHPPPRSFRFRIHQRRRAQGILKNGANQASTELYQTSHVPSPTGAQGIAGEPASGSEGAAEGSLNNSVPVEAVS
jgi:hypothetical protein